MLASSRKRSKKDRFLQQNPLCAYCSAPSEVPDHIPSRACFDKKIWPDGFWVPSCKPCNETKSQDEQMIAAFSRAYGNPSAEPLKSEVQKYFQGLANNDMASLKNMIERVIAENEQFVYVEPGPSIDLAFRAVLPKWGRAFHYMTTSEILPPDFLVCGRWFTLHQKLQGQIPEALFHMPEVPVRSGGTSLSGQFGFARQIPPDGSTFFYLALFRRSFGTWLAIDKTGEMQKGLPSDYLLPG